MSGWDYVLLVGLIALCAGFIAACIWFLSSQR